LNIFHRRCKHYNALSKNDRIDALSPVVLAGFCWLVSWLVSWLVIVIAAEHFSDGLLSGGTHEAPRTPSFSTPFIEA
jgi:hypothetical protein